jgi:hypothetical protein
MSPADLLVDADWVQAQLNDHPGVLSAEIDDDNPRRPHSQLLCNCHHGRDAHRHYRRGTDCAVCMCPRWSPRNPLLWLAHRSRSLVGHYQ